MKHRAALWRPGYLLLRFRPTRIPGRGPKRPAIVDTGPLCRQAGPGPAQSRAQGLVFIALQLRGLDGEGLILRAPHERALAEQRTEQIDGNFRRPIVYVESGIELHDVGRSQQSGVGDHLHAKLRFTI